MSVLVIGEFTQGCFTNDTLKVVSAAKSFTDDIALLVAGDGISEAIARAPKPQFVSRILVCDSPEFSHLIAEKITQLVLCVARNFTHLLTAANTTGKNFMPRVAAALDVQQVSDVTTFLSSNRFKHPIYAGNVIATVESHDTLIPLTVRPTAFDATETQDHSVDIEFIDVPEFMASAAFESEELTESDRPELGAAAVVVSGGRGLQSGDNFSMLYDLADKLNAAVGASRAAVDAGFVANDMQVGQTGKVVAPDLYVAVGISGAIQHLAGMKESKVIVAINKDEDAPIFQVADYGLVADLFDVVPELIEKLP